MMDGKRVRKILYEYKPNCKWTLSDNAIKEIYGDEVVAIYAREDF